MSKRRYRHDDTERRHRSSIYTTVLDKLPRIFLGLCGVGIVI